MSKIKKHISYFLLTILLVGKLGGLHTLTHFENDLKYDCDICEYVISANETSFLKSNSFELKEQLLTNYRDPIFVDYSYVFTKKDFFNSLFSRPPPELSYI